MRRISEADLARDWDSEIQRIQDAGEPVLITRDGAASVVFLPAPAYEKLARMAIGTPGGIPEALWAAIAGAPGGPS